MRAIVALSLTAVLLGGTATASMIEDLTGLHLQTDGGVHGDAPDTCEAVDPARQVLVDPEAATRGTMLVGDDQADFYLLPVSSSLVGTRVQVRVQGADLNLNVFDLDVQLPGCAGSVFDPATFDTQREMLQQDEDYSPTEPPAPGEKTVAADSLTGYACTPGEWHFVLNQVAGAGAPDHIRVQWSNGDILNVPIGAQTPATTVHYRTSANLDSQVWAAHVNVFQAWNGRFNLGNGPCNGPATAPPPPPFEAPVDFGTSGEFTVVTDQPYIIGAFVGDSGLPDLPLVVPASCHDICGPATDAAGASGDYDMFSAPSD